MRRYEGRWQSDKLKENVLNYFIKHLTWTIRRAKTNLQKVRSVIQRMIQKRILIFLYKLKLVQRLEHVDYKVQFDNANWCLQNPKSCLSYLHPIIFSDQCVFHISREVNKKSLEFGESKTLSKFAICVGIAKNHILVYVIRQPSHRVLPLWWSDCEWR